jgi:hypothetical protein
MSDKSRAKMQQIAERLLARTTEGAVRWEETDRKDSYVAVLEAGSVMIGPTGGLLKVAGLELTARNDRGLTIEKVAVSRDRPSALLPGQPGLPHAAAGDPNAALREVLSALHNAARRSALQVEKTLDSLLDQLD